MIHKWLDAYRILSDKLLRVTVEKITFSRKDSGTMKGFESFCHEIQLSNRTGTSIDGLKIEYRDFIQLSSGTIEANDPKRVVYGKINVGPMDDSKTKKVRTRGGRNFEEYPYMDKKRYDSMGNQLVVRPFGRCTVDGVWIRIHGPACGGVPTLLDICDP